MNTRQKKKQYKKQYGHNPLKGEDGRYLFHVVYGVDLGAGRNGARNFSSEQIESIKKLSTIKQEDIEHLRKLFREAVSTAAQAMSDLAAAISRACSDIAEQYKKPVIDQEDPPVVLAKSLAVRRKFRKKEWKTRRGR